MSATVHRQLVQDQIHKLKTKHKSPGRDKICPGVLKEYNHALNDSLFAKFKMSVKFSFVSSLRKVANVTPIFKIWTSRPL